MPLLQTLWKDDSGQDLVEYVILLIVVATTVGIAIVAFRQEIVTMFSGATTDLNAL